MRNPLNYLSSIIRADLKVTLWLGIAFVLVMLPNIFPAFWPVFKPGWLLVALHLAGLLLVPCLFGIQVRKILLLCWPFVCVAPIAIGCYLTTRESPRDWFFLTVVDTNFREASVFMPQIVGCGLLFIAMTVAYGWLMSRSAFKPLKLGPVSRTGVAICALLIPLGELMHSNMDKAWKSEQWRVVANFPVGTIISGVEAAQISYQIAHRGNLAKDLVVNSTVDPLPKGQREIHVLVIGETTRASSFGLNGYARQTTPLLAAQPGLLNFHDVVAPGPTTIISVPVILTSCNAASAQFSCGRPSVLNVFKKFGYRTYWLSTQLQHGRWDTPCSVFAKDAHEAKFLSGAFSSNGKTGDEAFDTVPDSALIDAVRSVLARGEEKVLLVLHTMGSHWIYSDRYPAEFNRFPSDPAICAAARLKATPEGYEQLRNSYDNTILFTDYVLSQLIHLLDGQGAVSSLYYVSDHGENGGDTAVEPFKHGTLTQEVLRVPMFIWLSGAYQTARPSQTNALRSHLETPFSADTTFHTLQDIAGLSCSFFKPQHSIASASFQPSPRLVIDLGSNLKDYDQMIAPTGCGMKAGSR
ncbi:MAG: phosphoethanolamine transferase [Verrucomicrobiota bacterium]